MKTRIQTMLIGTKKMPNGDVPFVVADGVVCFPSPEYYRARLEAYKAEEKKGLFDIFKKK